jgi:hypothetical protein
MICRYCQCERISDGQLSCHNCGKPYSIAYEEIRSRVNPKTQRLKKLKKAAKYLTFGCLLAAAMGMVLFSVAPSDPKQQHQYWMFVTPLMIHLIFWSLLAMGIYILIKERQQARKNAAPIIYGLDAISPEHDVHRPGDFFKPGPTPRTPIYYDEPPLSSSGKSYLIDYQDFDGNVTRRTITVKRISKEGGCIYIKAYCHLRDELRTFRRDRIIGQIIDEETGELLDKEILEPRKRKRPSPK